MFYKALYRKWRPQVFEDIIGQEQTVTILKNQIKYSNIAHAYLFTGMRGTGKTSTARIFARAVNCIDPRDANPCNDCEICKGILVESIMDVIEIDAASNTGVDNIREIRENTKYNPAKGKYKVYIIDEVHMLSKGAFNALLKTLEEPPAHVIFILSTTEPHKVPPTILSRCQRFDFKPIKIKDIINQLSLICKEMSIDYEKEALRLIALNSGGAVRDALSILDRCISFNNEVLKYDDVINMLGAVNYESIFDLAESIAKQDTFNVLTRINEIFAEGKDAGQLMKDIIFHFRSLLLVKMEVEIDELLTLPEERMEQFKEQSKLFDINQISSFIYTLSDIESKLKYSSQPKILTEIAVVSLCNKELDDSLEGIIERVKQLEKTMASGKREDKKIVDIKPEKPDIRQKEKLARNEKLKDSKKPGEGKKLKDDKKIENDKKPEDNEKSKDSNRALSTIKNMWGQILDRMIKDDKKPIKVLLEKGIPKELNKDVLIVSLEEGFEIYHKLLDEKEKKEYISDVIAKLTGQNVRLSFIKGDKPIISDNPGKQKDPVQKLKELLPERIFNIVEIIDR